MKFRLITVAFLISGSVMAQVNPVITATSLKLPSPEELVDAAVANSPHLKQQDALYQKNDYLIKTEKQKWISGIKFNFELGSGNQALLIQQAVGTVESYSNLNNGYRATLNLGVSAFDLVNRKSAVKIAEYEQKASYQQRDILIQELRLTVLTRYQAIMTSLRMLEIRSEAKQVNKQTRAMAEKEFAEGKIPVSELSTVIESAARADAEYETTRQTLIENIRVLEVLTGKKLL